MGIAPQITFTGVYPVLEVPWGLGWSSTSSWGMESSALGSSLISLLFCANSKLELSATQTTGLKLMSSKEDTAFLAVDLDLLRCSHLGMVVQGAFRPSVMRPHQQDTQDSSSRNCQQPSSTPNRGRGYLSSSPHPIGLVFVITYIGCHIRSILYLNHITSYGQHCDLVCHVVSYWILLSVTIII